MAAWMIPAALAALGIGGAAAGGSGELSQEQKDLLKKQEEMMDLILGSSRQKAGIESQYMGPTMSTVNQFMNQHVGRNRGLINAPGSAFNFTPGQFTGITTPDIGPPEDYTTGAPHEYVPTKNDINEWVKYLAQFYQNNPAALGQGDNPPIIPPDHGSGSGDGGLGVIGGETHPGGPGLVVGGDPGPTGRTEVPGGNPTAPTGGPLPIPPIFTNRPGTGVIQGVGTSFDDWFKNVADPASAVKPPVDPYILFRDKVKTGYTPKTPTAPTDGSGVRGIAGRPFDPTSHYGITPSPLDGGGLNGILSGAFNPKDNYGLNTGPIDGNGVSGVVSRPFDPTVNYGINGPLDGNGLNGIIGRVFDPTSNYQVNGPLDGNGLSGVIGRAFDPTSNYGLNTGPLNGNGLNGVIGKAFDPSSNYGVNGPLDGNGVSGVISKTFDPTSNYGIHPGVPIDQSGFLGHNPSAPPVNMGNPYEGMAGRVSVKPPVSNQGGLGVIGPQRDQVLSLIGQGRSPGEIASLLNMSLDQVHQLMGISAGPPAASVTGSVMNHVLGRG